MASDFMLDYTGTQLLFSNFALYFTATTDEYVRQKLLIKLRTIRGEWYLNKYVGIPYFTDIFELKNPDQEALESLFKTKIIETEGVQELTSFILAIDTASRIMKISFSVRVVNSENLVSLVVTL